MPWMSREDLFNAAWDRPLTTVAAELGVTSTALKKTCDRHDIPTPGRGYWAQVQAGKRFAVPKLRAVKDPRLEQVHIKGARPLPPPVVLAMEKVRAETPKPRRQRRKASSASPIQAAAAPVEETQAPQVVAPPPEPILRADRKDLVATRKALARARPDDLGFASCSGSGVIAACIGLEARAAAMAFLNELLDAAEARGWRLVPTEEGSAMQVDGEKLDIRLEDRPKKVAHVPTRKELTAQAQHERWGGTGQMWRRWDQAPSGRLAFIIEENHWTGIRKTFSKRGGFPLEDSIPVILEGLAGHAALKAETRRKREEEERQRALAEARRERIEAYRARETRREEFAELIANLLATRAKFQSVLEHVVSSNAAERPRLQSMEAWLGRRLALIEARLDPAALDISARHAEVGFVEPPPPRPSDRPSWHSPPKVALRLWRTGDGDGLAHNENELEWAIRTGLLADPAAIPAGDLPPES